MDAHELSSHVLEVVDDTAYRLSVRRVIGVHLAVGARRVPDVEQLNRAFAEAARGTVAEGAQLWVQVLPLMRHCRACGNTFPGTPAEQPCPACDHPRTVEIGGDEVRVVNIQVDDPAKDVAA